MSDEHVIIVRANLSQPMVTVSVDVGRLSPTIVAGLLYQASMALDTQSGPMVRVIYDDQVIAEIDPNEVIYDDDD